MPADSHDRAEALAAVDKLTFATASEQQKALLKRLVSDGFVTGSEDTDGRVKYTFSHPAAEAFYHALANAGEKQEAAIQTRDKAASKLEWPLKALNRKIVDAHLTEIISTFGFFVGDAIGGAASMLPRYQMIPSYYDKIEKGLTGHGDLLAEFAEVKKLADEVVQLDKRVIDPDYLNSLSAVHNLFIETPAFPGDFKRKQFSDHPASPVVHPVYLKTRAELGEHAVECLVKCADKIEKHSMGAEGAPELAKAIWDFATAIEEKGFERDFAALNAAFKALPPPQMSR